MSVFDLKGGSGNSWNYSDPQKNGYSEVLVGTVVEISNPQAINYVTKKPEFWDDGNPKRVLRLAIKDQSGEEKSFSFSPRSKTSEAFLAALDPQGTRPQVSISEALGKMVQIQTQAGSYNAANPRPWWVTILGDGDVQAVRGMVDLSQQQAQQPVQQQQQPVQQQRPVQQRPVQQQPAQQQPVQQVPAQMQYAMNQAAQAMGYQQQPVQQAQPVQQQQQPAPQVTYDGSTSVYDDDIPF